MIHSHKKESIERTLTCPYVIFGRDVKVYIMNTLKNKEKIVLKELKEIMGWMNEWENQQRNRTYVNKWIEML